MSIAELLDPRDPPTGADPEPATFAGLEAAGWARGSAGFGPWIDTQIGPCDVTVFPVGARALVTVNTKSLSEADACRLAHRLAEVLRDFEPTP